MKKLSQKRILHLLKKHCLTAKALFIRPVCDTFGDKCGEQVYAEEEIYFSNLLHRYNPHTSLKLRDESVTKTRLTPMAILVSGKGADVEEGDILRVNSKDYTVAFCENIRNCYYLLSLSAKK